LAITGAGPELESTQEHASGGSKFATCPVPELSPARSNYSEAATVVLSKSPPGARYRGNTQNARKGQEAPSYTYTLSPQRLKFAAGKGRKHKDLILSNFGDTSIEFDVIVPSYALAVEPAAGKVPPHSHIRIQVRAQKSFAGDGKPWIGSLFVLCNGERHPIEVIVGNERGAPPARMASRPANTPHAVQEKAARGVPGPKDDAHACCGLCFASSGLLFRAVSFGTFKTKKVKVCNDSPDQMSVKFAITGAAFSIEHRTVMLRPFSFVQLPVTFTPPTSGQHLGTIFVVSDTQEVSLRMQGECKEVSWR